MVMTRKHSRYVIGLISWADTQGSPLSSLNSDRQQYGKFKGTLQIVTGTQARWWMGWVVILQSAMRPDNVQLTILRLSHNQLYSRCALELVIRQGQSETREV